MRSRSSLSRYKREASAGLAYALLLLIVGAITPAFFNAGNLRDLAMNNAAVLIVALAMTLVILVGQIDISVGSQFAVCTIAAGWLAQSGVPMPAVLLAVIVVGALMGALGGALVAWLRMPSIVVTLALMVAWRDGLRWITEGEWVQNLPAGFQWFGLEQWSGQLLIIAIAILVLLGSGWVLRTMVVGRSIYAVGSDAEAARLVGIEPPRIIFAVFLIMGALVGLAATLNATRFSIVPSNAGIGFTGGRGTLIGTVVGVALLGTIGTALTFLGINPFWEKAIQGAIILAALVSDVALGRLNPARKTDFEWRTETSQ
jgi:rhamnose transport system permease protein